MMFIEWTDNLYWIHCIFI